MAEINKEAEIKKAEESKIEKVKIALDKLKNKENKFLFFIPQTNNPAASIYETYFHATTVKNMGYNVQILTDSSEFIVPDWIEKELTDFTHTSMDKTKLSVGPEDVLVIPEIFSNVMEQTKNLPCIRIGLLQSIDYMLNALVPGSDWSSFGVRNVITTSNNSKEIVETFFGKNKFEIKTYDIGIPDYFKPSEQPKRLVISIVGRNANEIAKVIKLFYAKYPEYSFVTFDSMLTDSKPPKNLSRKDYAERLGKNFAAVWIDRIASFGTLPIESMKCGTIPVGIVPDFVPDYLLDDEGEVIENSGIWTQDIYALPLLIGDVITKFLDDSIDEEVYERMSNISEKYNQENSSKQLQEIYKSFIDERINVFERTIQLTEEENKEEEVVK